MIGDKEDKDEDKDERRQRVLLLTEEESAMLERVWGAARRWHNRQLGRGDILFKRFGRQKVIRRGPTPHCDLAYSNRSLVSAQIINGMGA